MSTAEVGLEWTNRSEHWLVQSTKRRPVRMKPNRAAEPLMLSGHGVSLRVEHGALAIRNGFTHYPQTRETFRFFKGSPDLPPKIVMLDGSGGLSFEVMNWLAEQAIPLIRISWDGEAVSILGGSGTPFDAERVGWQIATRNDETRRLAFCRRLISEKLDASIHTLRTAVPNSETRTRAITVAELTMEKLERGAGQSVRDILTLEARAAAAYFLTWRGLPVRWKGLKQRPVPESWLTVAVRRSQSAFRNRATSRNATHPLNAMLNYAYAVLHSQVQGELVAAGYDPRRGVMHEARLDSCALVLDMIEPRRPVVDAAILKFIFANAFTAADFAIRSDGACRLTLQLARRVAQIAAEASKPVAAEKALLGA